MMLIFQQSHEIVKVNIVHILSISLRTPVMPDAASSIIEDLA
jgi:hypothetical protein